MYRNNSMKTVSSINAEEVTKFEKLATEWWDAEGKFKPLHMLNPCRLEFITDNISFHFQNDMISYGNSVRMIQNCLEYIIWTV